MIVYFSGTGNSRYCAQMLASVLQDELLDSAQFIRHQIAAELISGKPWIFVSPTYAWQLPRIFAEFIRSGNFAGSTDAYFVMTCGSDIGNAQAWIEPLCEEKGLSFKGVLEVVMPENYVVMFDVPEKAEAERIIKAAHPVLEAGADCVRKGAPFPEKKISLQDKAKSGKINQVFYKRYVHARDFLTTGACISCGKCVEACVLGNVHLDNGRPVWGENCTHCMACICGCPAEAIEFGRKSVGKPRYWCPEYKD